MTRFRDAVKAPLRFFTTDAMGKSAAWLLLDQAVLASSGFLFWIIAAHRATPRVVALATATVGALSLVGSASTLGLPNATVRFWSTHARPVALLRRGLRVVAVTSVVVGLAWVLFARSWALPPHVSLFLSVVVVAGVLGFATGNVATFALIAQRATSTVVVKDVVGVLTKFLLLFVVSASATGLITATVGGAVSSMVVAFAAATHYRAKHRRGAFTHPNPRHARRTTPPTPTSPSTSTTALTRELILRPYAKFALGNHVAVVVASVPLYVLPALLVWRMGASSAASATIPLLLVTALNVIPQSVTNSLLAEASRDVQKTRALVVKGIKAIYAAVLPASALLVLLAPYVLTVFGTHYARSGTTCVRLLASALLLASFNYVADTLLLVFRKVRAYMAVNVAGTIAVLGATTWLSSHGPTGFALGWCLGQVLYVLIALVALWRTGVLKTLRSSPSSAPSAEPVLTTL